jgi:hypothetical protein
MMVEMEGGLKAPARAKLSIGLLVLVAVGLVAVIVVPRGGADIKAERSKAKIAAREYTLLQDQCPYTGVGTPGPYWTPSYDCPSKLVGLSRLAPQVWQAILAQPGSANSCVAIHLDEKADPPLTGPAINNIDCP